MATEIAVETQHNYIGGKWVPSASGATFENRNPADRDELIGLFPKSGKADVDAAVAAAKKAFPGWKNTPAPRRAEVLYAAGEMTMEQPLKQRRKVLEGLVEREQARTRVGSRLTSTAQQGELLFETAVEEKRFARLVLAPAVQLESTAQLEQAYVDARARGNEGVMLKARHSTYQPGRRGLAWLKLKRELATLDVVVTAAEYGHGKRAGWLRTR